MDCMLAYKFRKKVNAGSYYHLREEVSKSVKKKKAFKDITMSFRWAEELNQCFSSLTVLVDIYQSFINIIISN